MYNYSVSYLILAVHVNIILISNASSTMSPWFIVALKTVSLIELIESNSRPCKGQPQNSYHVSEGIVEIWGAEKS